MTVIELEREGVHGRLVYKAVPLQQSLTQKLEGTDFAKQAVPWIIQEDVDGFSSYVMVDDKLVHITASMSNIEVSTSPIYSMPKVWPKGHTSLCVGAESVSKSAVNKAVDNMLKMWECTETNMYNQSRDICRRGLEQEVKDHSHQLELFRIYERARKSISEQAEIVPAEAPGEFEALFRSYPTFFNLPQLGAEENIWLTHRIQGKAGDLPVNLGLVHIAGRRFIGFNGIMVYTMHNADEGEMLPFSLKAAAGHVLRQDVMFLGCMRKQSQEAGIGVDSPDLIKKQPDILKGEYFGVSDFANLNTEKGLKLVNSYPEETFKLANIILGVETKK